jgi:hypothetical protein
MDRVLVQRIRVPLPPPSAPLKASKRVMALHDQQHSDEGDRDKDGDRDREYMRTIQEVHRIGESLRSIVPCLSNMEPMSGASSKANIIRNNDLC